MCISRDLPESGRMNEVNMAMDKLRKSRFRVLLDKPFQQ
jgi:hypothetical protein